MRFFVCIKVVFLIVCVCACKKVFVCLLVYGLVCLFFKNGKYVFVSVCTCVCMFVFVC